MDVKSALKSKKFWKQQCVVALACLMCTVPYNLIITPHHLYAGNFTGIAQLLRTILIDIVHIPIPKGFDIMGVLLYALNIPILILAYKKIGKLFFLKSIIGISLFSLGFSLIPVLEEPLIPDTLTSCIISGFISGTGGGLLLRQGSSAGGIDIIGIYMAQKNPNYSVGKCAIAMAAFVYTACFFLYDFNVEVVVYSVIFTCVTSFAVDRSHYQTIKLSAIIFTKNPQVGKLILEDLDRGYTEWVGKGGYSQEEMLIYYTVINRYEANQLKKQIFDLDDHAFVSIQKVSEIEGTYVNHM